MFLIKRKFLVIILLSYVSVGLLFLFITQSYNSFTFFYVILLWPLILFMAIASPDIFIALLLISCIIAIFIKIKYYFVASSCIVSIILVLASLVIPATVQTHEQLSTLRFGWPLAYIVQDQSHYDPPLPRIMHFGTALENPTHLLLPKFIGSLIIVLIPIIVFLYTFRYFRSAKPKKITV